jgi:hypothetical protein
MAFVISDVSPVLKAPFKYSAIIFGLAASGRRGVD